MEQFLGGLQVLLQWQNFLIIPVGLAIGIIVGAIPGLTSDLGLILCIPLTYGMDPTMAILMLLAIYCGGTYGGSITAIRLSHDPKRTSVQGTANGTVRINHRWPYKRICPTVSGSPDRKNHTAVWPCRIFCFGSFWTIRDCGRL